MKRTIAFLALALVSFKASAFTCADDLPTGEFSRQLIVNSMLKPTSETGEIKKIGPLSYRITLKNSSFVVANYLLNVSAQETGFGCAATLKDESSGLPVSNLGLKPNSAAPLVSIATSAFDGETSVVVTSLEASSCEGCQGGFRLDNYLVIK